MELQDNDDDHADDEPPFINEGDAIVDVQYLPELESVCIATKLGSLLLVAVKGDRSVELVGMLPGKNDLLRDSLYMLSISSTSNTQK